MIKEGYALFDHADHGQIPAKCIKLSNYSFTRFSLI